jgi:hypothetical protein
MKDANFIDLFTPPTMFPVKDILASMMSVSYLKAKTCYDLIRNPNLYDYLELIGVKQMYFAAALCMYVRGAYKLIPDFDLGYCLEYEFGQDTYNAIIRSITQALEVFYD